MASHMASAGNHQLVSSTVLIGQFYKFDGVCQSLGGLPARCKTVSVRTPQPSSAFVYRTISNSLTRRTPLRAAKP